MAGSIRPSDRPKAHGMVQKKSLIGFRAACGQMWGAEGMEAIRGGLPPDVAERTAGLRPLPDWVRLEDLVAWHFAVWNGPAKRDEQTMTRHIHATIDEGFGKVKRLFLSTQTPHSLAPRVVSLWRDEYSTGFLEASAVEERSLQLSLREHSYVDIGLMRYVIAEVFRYVASLTRVTDVTAVHAVRDSALIVVLRWP